MKELLIIRHAKSSWEDPQLRDKQRPLAPRGERAAPLMGERIARSGWLPELIVSSDARRAQQTAKLIATAMGLDQQLIVLDERLYTAGPKQWLDVIADQPDTYRRIAMVGHNPAIEETARELFAQEIDKVPTAAVLYGRIGADQWSQVGVSQIELVYFDYPKLAS